MDHKIKRHSDHVSITSEDDGWCVSVTNNGFQFWSIGTIFPTERGALMVATAIELALTAAELDRLLYGFTVVELRCSSCGDMKSSELPGNATGGERS